MDIAEKIKSLRLQLGLDQREFGELIGVAMGTISNWENNRRFPRMNKIRKMIEIAKSNKIKLEPKDFMTF